MSAAELAGAERTGLCDAFDAVGPDAPTLCEGWTTADLAAHLVVREHRPDALPGIVGGGPFARHTQRLMDAAKQKGYASMVATLRSPSLLFRGPGAFGNVVEYWIHHEDVRRANGQGPRATVPELDAFLWRTLALTGRGAARKVKPIGFELDGGEGRRRVLRDADPRVVMRGAPGEIALYLSGRKAAAQVLLDGPDDACRVVAETSFGM
jgi:uncharacterized protein (TIGR03085 family)